MHSVVQLKLLGYREWTETLGFRREHVIQQVQAELHKRAWAGFTSMDALPHQMRYDFLLVYANNVPYSRLVEGVRTLAEVSPVPVNYCVGRGETPLEAYENCDDVKDTSGRSAIVGHMDVVNSTLQTEKRSPYDIYLMVSDLLNSVNAVCKGLGCLAFYLGGDNIMVLLPDVRTAYMV
ncbi:MAG: GTP cyclohydrolase IIa, partial [Thermoproteus sp.]|nr:GTP cyclohydrolase IIa [Thermoproteus sp.]